jgi:hypothetical protein
VGTRPANTHTLVLAPLGVTYHLKLVVGPRLFIEARDLESGGEKHAFTAKIAVRILQVAGSKLGSVAERFSGSYRNFS